MFDVEAEHMDIRGSQRMDGAEHTRRILKHGEQRGNRWRGRKQQSGSSPTSLITPSKIKESDLGRCCFHTRPLLAVTLKSADPSGPAHRCTQQQPHYPIPNRSHHPTDHHERFKTDEREGR
jgi:hypothetical protein